MRRSSQSKSKGFKLPDVEIGSWKARFIGTPRGSIGQLVQQAAKQTSVELTYLVLAAEAEAPTSRHIWPAVATFWVPTIMKTDVSDAGVLFRTDELPSLGLSLEVTRTQFSDICWLLKARRLSAFHFTVLEPTADNRWPLKSWGASFEL